MEPITTLIVTAIALGAAAGLRPATEQAVKDAYAGLKRIIIDRYNDHRNLVNAVEALGENPEDTNQQAVLGTELANAGADKDPILIEAANAVHIAGAPRSSKKRVLGRRLQRKIKQFEALGNQIDLTIDDSQKVILEEKAEILWAEISELEEELLQMDK